MEALALTFRGEVLRSFPLGERPLEVGSGPGADIVVHDTSVAARHYLLCREGPDVTAFDVRPVPSPDAPKGLAPGAVLRVGREHALVRVVDGSHELAAPAIRTEVIAHRGEVPEELVLVVGRHGARRTHPIRSRPLTIGSSSTSDVVLADRSVSAQHARIEPSSSGPTIRDLDSRNGTFVDGVRALAAQLWHGTRIRLGRTDLEIRARAGRSQNGTILAASPKMRDVLTHVAKVAPRPWPVLVRGDSGVGKEGIARLLHDESPRRSGPFVAVNAGGLPRELVESELFGHAKGAFTGATTQHRGVFEQASGGTLFLDEIGELSLELQARLLRVIETGEIRRVGAESTERVDVRLVCATHRDLRARARQGAFRLDLYYRIAQVVLEIPPLSERPEDVRALAEHFLREAESEVGARALTDDALASLAVHTWPGNARELKNVIRSAALETAGHLVDRVDVERAIARLTGDSQPDLDAVVQRYDGNLSAAARALGLPRTTLRDRRRKSDPPER